VILLCVQPNKRPHRCASMGQEESRPGSQPVVATTYDELAANVQQANSLAAQYTDSKNRKLEFTLYPPSTDGQPPPFWRGRATIVVSKVPQTKRRSHGSQLEQKPLDIKQFYKLFELMNSHSNSKESGGSGSGNGLRKPSVEEARQTLKTLEADAKVDSECPICLERPTEVALPECNHAFCQQCLDDWMSRSDTCPYCRQLADGSDDVWVLTQNLSKQDLGTYFSDYLDQL